MFMRKMLSMPCSSWNSVSAFSKVLGLKKGDVESLLPELARGRIGRRGIPPIGQFLIKLLSIIEKDIEETSISYSNGSSESWL